VVRYELKKKWSSRWWLMQMIVEMKQKTVEALPDVVVHLQRFLESLLGILIIWWVSKLVRFWLDYKHLICSIHGSKIFDLASELYLWFSGNGFLVTIEQSLPKALVRFKKAHCVSLSAASNMKFLIFAVIDLQAKRIFWSLSWGMGKWKFHFWANLIPFKGFWNICL